MSTIQLRLPEETILPGDTSVHILSLCKLFHLLNLLQSKLGGVNPFKHQHLLSIV